MGAGASQHRRAPSLRLVPDTPGVVVSLQPYEHLTLSLDLLSSHRDILRAALARGLFASIRISAAVVQGGVSRVQLHVPLPTRLHPPRQQQSAAEAAFHAAPPTSPADDDSAFSPAIRLTAAPAAAAAPLELSLHLLSVDSSDFRPATYPLSLTNLDCPSLVNVTAKCRIDDPLALQRDLLELRTDHRRLAWELHSAQQHVAHLQTALHSLQPSTHSHPHPLSSLFNPSHPDVRPPSPPPAAAFLDGEQQPHHIPLSTSQRRLLHSFLSTWKHRALLSASTVSLRRRSRCGLLSAAWREWRAQCARASPDAERQPVSRMDVRHEQVQEERPTTAKAIGEGRVDRLAVSQAFHAWRSAANGVRQQRRMLAEAMAGKMELRRQWRVWKHWTSRVQSSRVEAARRATERRSQQEQLSDDEEDDQRRSQPQPKAHSAHEDTERATDGERSSQESAVTASAEELHARRRQRAARRAFLGWRELMPHSPPRGERPDRVTSEQQRATIRAQQALRRRKQAAAVRERNAQPSRPSEERRQSASLDASDALAGKSSGRLLQRAFLRWKDGWFSRREQKRDALRSMCAIRAKEEMLAAFTLWSAHTSTVSTSQQRRPPSKRRARAEETKEADEYIATVMAPGSLPVVGFSRTLPGALTAATAVDPSNPASHSSSAMSLSRSELTALRGRYGALHRLYSRLFLLVQAFHAEVVKEWASHEVTLLAHSTCRCEVCRMRSLARGRGGVHVAWMKRFERDLEHFRYVQ